MEMQRSPWTKALFTIHPLTKRSFLTRYYGYIAGQRDDVPWGQGCVPY